ncbi:MAG TPA: hypothetical protein VH684_27210 [Xanthobacteraceae bacterium]|jgi:hypothetical protein
MIQLFSRVCCIAGCVLATSAYAAGPFGLIRSGLWQGGAYTNDATGQFSHCAAGVQYQGGIFFMVVMDASGGWGLGFVHQSWQLQLGEVFPIDLTFNGQGQFHVFGKAIAHNQVLVPMPTNSALMTLFKKSSSMSAVAKGQLFQFNLNGTAQLIPSLANCVASIKAKGLANAGDFTVAQPPKAAVATPAPSTGGSLKAEAPQIDAAEMQIEAVELASNFILKASLHNPRVLSRAEAPIAANNGAAWQSDEASGFVRVIPTQPGTKGLDVTAAVIASDAKDCKGEFASARKSALIDSDVIFEGMVTCKDSDGSRLSHYFIVPRAKGGFAMFSVVSNMKTDLAQGVTKEEKLVDFRKAALVVGAH